MPNLVQIRETAAEIWRFFDFSQWRPPHLEFLIFLNFNGLHTQEGETASLCQILLKLVKPRMRYCDFSIFFKMAAAAVLDFENFNGRTAQEG